MIFDPIIIKGGGLPDNLRTITVTADPPERGTVEGGGMASDGMTVTVKAEAAADGNYLFGGWQESGNTVSEEAEYTFPVAGNRTLQAVFNEETSRLPDGYTELQYVYAENNIGTGRGCAILTGIIPTTTDSKVVMDFEADEGITDQVYLFGGSLSSGSYRIVNKGDTISYCFANGGAGEKTISTDIRGRRMQFVADWKNKLVFIGENSYPISSVTAPPSSGQIIILNYYKSGTGKSALGKVYSFKVYSGEELQADFVPCTDPTGVVGFYDIIREAFYADSANNTPASLHPGPAV